MAVKSGKGAGIGGQQSQLVLAVAVLGFIIFLLAYAAGFCGLSAEMFALTEGVFLALVTLYCLWKFDDIDKRLCRQRA